MADDIGKPEPRAADGVREPLPGSAGPLDIAMAAAAASGPESPAWRLLEEQQRLVREQVALAGNERFRNRIKAARDASLALLALALIFVAAWALWDASRADDVVVERFTVPPDLAAQGLTGEMVANRLLDHITQMDASIDYEVRAGMRARSAGSGELRVDIPQAGVSLADLSRHLRRTLGRERAVTGEVWRRGDQLMISARVAGSPGDLVAGAPGTDPDAVVRAMAERVFRRTQPIRYGEYLLFLTESPLPPEEERAVLLRAAEVFRSVAESESRDRAWGYAYWGDTLARSFIDVPKGLELLQTAVRLDPELGFAHANLAVAYGYLGEPQRRLHHALNAERAFGRKRTDADDRHNAFGARAMRRYIQIVTGAYADLARDACSQFDRGVDVDLTRRSCVQGLAESHDGASARRRIALLGRQDEGSRLLFLSYVAEGRGDWPAVLAARRAYEARVPQGPERERMPTNIWPRTAITLARAGLAAEAQALSARTPGCYDCLRARGWAAAAAGDAAAAERWFARAVRRGPEVPWGYYNQAETRLLRGDAAGAIQAAREAQEHGPRWADPFKIEGDARARLGEHRAAIRSYREAAERAPRWGALHLAWGRSLEALGREEQARAKYAEAARLDLSPADRAEINRRLRAS